MPYSFNGLQAAISPLLPLVPINRPDPFLNICFAGIPFLIKRTARFKS